MASIFNLHYFNKEHIISTKTNILLEKAYDYLPQHIFKDTEWFYNTLKDTRSNLETLLLGESYRVAWSRDQSHYLLFTKTGDPNSIIIIDNLDPNLSLVNRSLSSLPPNLPPSDDEEEKETAAAAAAAPDEACRHCDANMRSQTRADQAAASPLLLRLWSRGFE